MTNLVIQSGGNICINIQRCQAYKEENYKLEKEYIEVVLNLISFHILVDSTA